MCFKNSTPHYILTLMSIHVFLTVCIFLTVYHLNPKTDYKEKVQPKTYLWNTKKQFDSNESTLLRKWSHQAVNATVWSVYSLAHINATYNCFNIYLYIKYILNFWMGVWGFRIGCGLDKLSWEKVSLIIDEVFQHTDIAITIYSL